MLEAAIQGCFFETVFLKRGKIHEITCEKAQFLVKLQSVNSQLY